MSARITPRSAPIASAMRSPTSPPLRPGVESWWVSSRTPNATRAANEMRAMRRVGQAVPVRSARTSRPAPVAKIRQWTILSACGRPVRGNSLPGIDDSTQTVSAHARRSAHQSRGLRSVDWIIGELARWVLNKKLYSGSSPVGRGSSEGLGESWERGTNRICTLGSPGSIRDPSQGAG